jgi:guanylate kinase
MSKRDTGKMISQLLIFSAPSGAGKTTIVKELVRRHDNFIISVSVTTRDMRPGETNGLDYFFVSRREFEKLIKEGMLLEYEAVHGEYYGTLKSVVDENIADNKVVLFDIDVNGAKGIKKQYPQALLFFIKPPNLEILRERLRKRRRESEEEIKKRLKRITFEYEQAESFDHIIINDNLNKTIEEIESIVRTGT